MVPTSDTESRRPRHEDAPAGEGKSVRPWRSIAAVLVGFLSVAILSLATDQVFHVTGVYPPWGEPMWDTGLNVLALSYRVVFAFVGGYITASLAPTAPMRHVVILGLLGLLAGTAGAVAAIQHGNLGPNWYPMLVAITAYPCTWIGGLTYSASRKTAEWGSAR